MSDDSVGWKRMFADLFTSSVEKYQSGHHRAKALVDSAENQFLASIGYSEQEFFDFVEDFAKGGEPTLATALSIAEVRRDYFLKEQGGHASSKRVVVSDLPAKDAALDGIAWLPRIIQKAEAKLRGEMPAELMYGCGGDRRFFRTNEIDPADFLREIWKTNGDSKKIADWVRAQKIL